MRKLTFHGPAHRLRLPSGREVDRGETGEVTNDDADAAEAADNVNVTVHQDGDTSTDSDEE